MYNLIRVMDYDVYLSLETKSLDWCYVIIIYDLQLFFNFLICDCDDGTCLQGKCMTNLVQIAISRII